MVENFILHPRIQEALTKNKPILALESTIIAHGMPYPENLQFARKAEKTVLDAGVVPATIAILNGCVHIGLTSKQMEQLLEDNTVVKAGARDLSIVIGKKMSAATTVSATMTLAHLVGIRVFSTGGIGGVHRGSTKSMDISQDLKVLGQIPMIVISAGAKAILDLPKTCEYLETEAVPVIGFCTDEFPAFYSRKSGLPVTERVDRVEELVRMFSTHLKLGLKSAFLITNPVPKADEIPAKEMETIIEKVLLAAHRRGMKGKEVTPFLLNQLVEISQGRSLKTNISLALNNIKLGCKIARVVSINNI